MRKGGSSTPPFPYDGSGYCSAGIGQYIKLAKDQQFELNVPNDPSINSVSEQGSVDYKDAAGTPRFARIFQLTRVFTDNNSSITYTSSLGFGQELPKDTKDTVHESGVKFTPGGKKCHVISTKTRGDFHLLMK
jgi:hypothetical protein